jgi:hypothetical protein
VEGISFQNTGSGMGVGNKGGVVIPIYGLSGADSISILETAAVALNDDVHPDYWLATEGNAKRPLLQLLAMAKLRPDGIWSGD